MKCLVLNYSCLVCFGSLFFLYLSGPLIGGRRQETCHRSPTLLPNWGPQLERGSVKSCNIIIMIMIVLLTVVKI